MRCSIYGDVFRQELAKGHGLGCTSCCFVPIHWHLTLLKPPGTLMGVADIALVGEPLKYGIRCLPMAFWCVLMPHFYCLLVRKF